MLREILFNGADKKKKMTLMTQNIPVFWIPVDIGHHHHSNTGHSVAWLLLSLAGLGCGIHTTMKE